MSRHDFGIGLDESVVTSTYVINDNLPILYVSNEFDEEEGQIWQFHCGNNDYDMSKMLLVRLEDILIIDITIGEVSELPVNFVAKRDCVGGDWVFSKE